MTDTESKDTRCPHCNGDKQFVIAMHRQWCDCTRKKISCPTRTENCWTCNGTGILIGLRRVIYKARGGPAPRPFRGYA